MLAWGLLFVFAALISGAFGWGEVSATVSLAGRIFFFLFLVLLAASLLGGAGVSAL